MLFASFQMTDQESFFPAPELIHPVDLGDDLADILLSFEKSYMPA
jgi:hypothetical protein